MAGGSDPSYMYSNGWSGSSADHNPVTAVRAARVVASLAQDAADARLLLDILDLTSAVSWARRDDNEDERGGLEK
ncbi:hypothetical protein [Pseudonocardia sp. ICBG1142]|uniref:hypothetical protein n=1 Tax=Pseudonocardia sp. ICBG1142 TaxID=2846760 RepID=UPI001CF6DAF3|nr:hypothetical protein [Pseudonocardia sp. ICBG1142]